MTSNSEKPTLVFSAAQSAGGDELAFVTTVIVSTAHESSMLRTASEWRFFPDPRKGDVLIAPIGPGAYELRRGKKLLRCAASRYVARRMSSLLPKPSPASRELGLATGSGKDDRISDYVQKHLAEIEFRTIAFSTREEADDFVEQHIGRESYMFLD